MDGDAMALVPYRVSGPAVDQRATERLLQFPWGITMRIMQWPGLSGATAPRSEPAAACSVPPFARPASNGANSGSFAIANMNPRSQHLEQTRKQHHQPDQQEQQKEQQQRHQQQQRQGPLLSNLANVGLVVWQAGFLLADFLIREAPECAPTRRGCGDGCSGVVAGSAAHWRSMTVVDLGTGSGVVGIALALAGARVFLTDLPHVVPLTVANVMANCDQNVHQACVCAYQWGDDPAWLPAAPAAVAFGVTYTGVQPLNDGSAAVRIVSPLAGVEPDVITAADVLYHEDLLQPLMKALWRLSAPHTVSYVSYRVRHGGEVIAFRALAEAAGFAVEEVPDEALHEEYRRCGGAGAYGSSLLGAEAPTEVSDGEADFLTEDCGGVTLLAPGTYGILRLCRRDCVMAVTVSGPL